MLDFNKMCKCIFEQLLINQQQNEKLIQIRDTLLPKLINGDIRVSY